MEGDIFGDVVGRVELKKAIRENSGRTRLQ